MTLEQEVKIKELIEKYNDILLVSMRLAVSEDFMNLMLLNRDDTDFILKDLFKNKEDFSRLLMKEFLKKNSTSVLQDLKHMENDPKGIRKRFLKQKKQ